MQSFWNNILRTIFFFIDKIVYFFVRVSFDTFIQISKISEIFGNDTVSDIAGRIYAILGVFMVFKVTFSLITYMVNPDVIADKEKGLNKLVVNILITLCLVVFVPLGFEWLYQIQDALIEDQTVQRLILGDDEGYDTDEFGRELVVTSFTAFFEPMADSATYARFTAKGSSTYGDLSLFEDELNDTIGDSKEYKYSYSPIISTVCGVILVWLILTFCIDIGLRAVKLGFLEMIAPIPIISYVDPKSGKGGIFSRWIKSVISTFLDLFIRLATIYLVILVVRALADTLKDTLTPLAKILFLLGAFLFAKKAPEIMADIFGLKGAGKSESGKMLGKATKVAAGTAVVGGALAAAGVANAGFGLGRAVGGAVNAGNATFDKTGNRWKAFGSGLLSGTAGVIGAGLSGITGMTSAGARMAVGWDKKAGALGNAIRGVQGATNKRNLRDDWGTSGHGGLRGFMGRRAYDVKRFINDPTRKTPQERFVKDIEQDLALYKTNAANAREVANNYGMNLDMNRANELENVVNSHDMIETNFGDTLTPDEMNRVSSGAVWRQEDLDSGNVLYFQNGHLMDQNERNYMQSLEMYRNNQASANAIETGHAQTRDVDPALFRNYQVSDVNGLYQKYKASKRIADGQQNKNKKG